MSAETAEKLSAVCDTLIGFIANPDSRDNERERDQALRALVDLRNHLDTEPTP